MARAAGGSEKALLAFDWPTVLSTLRRFTGTKRRVSEEWNSKSNASCEGCSMTKSALRQLVVCVKNDGYAVSLETRKIYVSIADPLAEKHGQLRVIDESGEDYLYPKAFFRVVALPQSVKKAGLIAALWGGLGGV